MSAKTFTDPDMIGDNAVDVGRLDAKEEVAPGKIGSEELQGLDKGNILPSGSERPRRNVDYAGMDSSGKVKVTDELDADPSVDQVIIDNEGGKTVGSEKPRI